MLAAMFNVDPKPVGSTAESKVRFRSTALSQSEPDAKFWDILNRGGILTLLFRPGGDASASFSSCEFEIPH